MADIFTKKKRSEVMSRIRSEDTKPELEVRKVLFAMGYRYKLHYGEYSIDIAMPKKKIAIFIDGCFWHGCPQHFRLPKSNVSFWETKIKSNLKRDRKVNKALKSNGWKVVRVREHEIRKNKSIYLRRLKRLIDTQDIKR